MGTHPYIEKLASLMRTTSLFTLSNCSSFSWKKKSKKVWFKTTKNDHLYDTNPKFSKRRSSSVEVVRKEKKKTKKVWFKTTKNDHLYDIKPKYPQRRPSPEEVVHKERPCMSKSRSLPNDRFISYPLRRASHENPAETLDWFVQLPAIHNNTIE